VYALKMPAEAHALTDPRFRRALTQMVRRRVPESDAEDIVQSSLAEALASERAPADMDSLRRFVWGIARHKVADFYRRARRERLDVPEMEGPGAPHTEHDLLRWAARELPEGKDAEQTLDWMLREGEGEKLEAIAEAENVPAPRVRQRVSRLRRHLRERWAIEVAALAAIGVVVALIVWEMSRQPGKPITNEPALHQDPVVPKVKAPEPPKSLPGTSDVPNDPSSTPGPAPVPSSSALPSTPGPSSVLPTPPIDPKAAPMPTPTAPTTSATPPPAKPRATPPSGKSKPGPKTSDIFDSDGTPSPSDADLKNVEMNKLGGAKGGGGSGGTGTTGSGKK
jgi:DNA-directed RNA polymerase specialized sigma24 family protein